MTTRMTRGAVAKEKAFLSSTEKENIPQQLSSPPATPVSKSKRPLSAQNSVRRKTRSKVKLEITSPDAVVPKVNNKKRKSVSATKVEDDDINALPHNLGTVTAANDSSVKDEVKEETERTDKKKKKTPRKTAVQKEAEEVEETIGKTADIDDLPDESPAKKSKKERKPKANPYGLTPGVSPFPDWPHPTPEECQTVNDLLSEVHGKVIPPVSIPVPSLTVSGCGEVPSVLDALIRTLLSAATSGSNSARAFQGLVAKFGILKDGIGKGSVDWDAVRRAPLNDVFEAIKSGGLANNKSKNIKAILDTVYDENKARRDALLEAKDSDPTKGPIGAENETEGEKEIEIARANQNVLSLDHIHALSAPDAISTLIKLPGIGPKTASCVTLFCLRRPSFAVDTHVFRLCKWLGWVPLARADRNKTYSHCDVRIPDELKYPLHQLMIMHGKKCPRCRANTGEGSARWDDGCPIEHLVTRDGKMKGPGKGSPAKKVGKGASTKRTKRRKSDISSDEAEEDIEEEKEDEEAEEEDGNHDEEDEEE